MTVEEFYQQIKGIIEYEPIMCRANSDVIEAMLIVFGVIAAEGFTPDVRSAAKCALLTGFSLGHDYALKYGRIGLEPKLIEVA